MNKRLIYTSLLFLVILLLPSPNANAVPTLTLFDGTTTVTITDGGIGDLSALPGVVQFSGSIGTWWINLVGGITKPATGSATLPNMDLVSQNTSRGAGTLTVTWSDDNYGTLPVGGNTLAGLIGGTAGGSGLVYNVLYGAGNGIPATTNILTVGPFAAGSFSGSAVSGVLAGTYPFSLSEQVVFSHSGAGTTSFNAALTAVPEPSALLLLGFGLSALGVWKIRKRG